MKNTLLCAFILFQFSLTFSQEIATDIQGKKVDYFVAIEKKLNSELFDTNHTYLSSDDTAQPLIYKRKEKNIPDLVVFYSFNKKDSIVSEVLYEWDVYNFEKKDNNVKSEQFNKALIEKYKSLLKTLTNKYGESETEGNLDNFKAIESPKGIARTDNWKPNDSLEIEMYTAISNYYKKEGFVTTIPTHRIRLYIRNIQKKVESKFDEKAASLSNQNFENFIAKLKENNFVEAKLFLSDIVLQKVTENQLVELRKAIDFDHKLIIFLKGFQMAAGKNYLMMQYKYANEENDVPKSIIKVIFDDENKILGIQPMKRE